MPPPNAEYSLHPQEHPEGQDHVASACPDPTLLTKGAVSKSSPPAMVSSIKGGTAPKDHVKHVFPGVSPFDSDASPRQESKLRYNTTPTSHVVTPQEAPPSPKSSSEVLDYQKVRAYRERIARDMERRERAIRSPHSSHEARLPISPVQEEDHGEPSTSSASGTDFPTASTESNRTVRGAMHPSFAARTPSYPFPRMNTPNPNPSLLQRSFTPYSPKVLAATGGHFENPVLYDQLRSDPSTPASAMTFQPTGHFEEPPENFDFPTPSLYDLSLLLSSEPGLDAWWDNVIEIMTECYKAERVTLSVPADTTDIDNVPWGQKATYNIYSEDELSIGYLGRGSSLSKVPCGDSLDPAARTDSSRSLDRLKRPALRSHHSFTAYEENKEAQSCQSAGEAGPSLLRPGLGSRSKTYYHCKGSGDSERMSSSKIATSLNERTLEEHDAAEDQRPVPTWETQFLPVDNVKGRVLPVLQALDLEADPLIDHNGINRVIERGKVIALTRSYPYLDPDETRNPRNTSPEQAKTNHKSTAEPTKAKTPVFGNWGSTGRFSHHEGTKLAGLGHSDDPPQHTPAPKYEEYEQAPPSPWSQSPAPSPAVRADPSENPFFRDAMVDEESFNPGPSPQDYTTIQVPETIGVDNSWTVLHIPLQHVLFSKPTKTQPFKLQASALGQKSVNRENTGLKMGVPDGSGRSPSPEQVRGQRPTPMAILSILTPVIPYPSNLRHSLQYLAPHLASSFSQCRHYSNLQTEMANPHRRRSPAAGFGAVAPDGRPLANLSGYPNAPFENRDSTQPSLSGSITSPSEMSNQSRSITGTPGTPVFESSVGLLRASGNSPGAVQGDSYFTTRPVSRGVAAESPAGTSSASSRMARDNFSVFDRRHRHSSSLRSAKEPGSVATDTDSSLEKEKEVVSSSAKKGKDSDGARPVPRPASKDSGDQEDRRKRYTHQSLMGQHAHRHSQLHSYGGDFAATFQSLPPSTSLPAKTPVLSSGPSRPGTAHGSEANQPPPSDKLKSLMLDSLPVQVFVALPQNGEVAWVNSRYLSYRGQSVDDLIADPWSSVHPEDREDYLKAWSTSIRKGDSFDSIVRLRRFDGAYKYHQTRAIPSRDRRGIIVQFIGSHMDIHERHMAEMKAIRQEQTKESERKYRLLANLIPQITFAATESDGITFANEQWTSYTGQDNEKPLGLSFMSHVHPDDMAKCLLFTRRGTPSTRTHEGGDTPSDYSSSTLGSRSISTITPTTGPSSVHSPQAAAMTAARSRHDSSASGAIPPNASPDLMELARKGMIKISRDSNDRPSYTTELRIKNKSGEYRWHLVRCVEIDNIDFGNGASSFFGSATDINDQKLLEEKLKEAMESKGRFLSNMSHEIRTPLIGISGMVSFLQDTILNEEQRDYTNTIQTSANSLLMIINDILDLSKVDAGMMKLKYEWFHTRSLIEDVNELVSTMAVSKRLELNYIVEEDVPSWVKGDKVRIRQVLLNIIGNAIKFTSEGEVFSECRVCHDPDSHPDENKILLEFSVIDTGRGFTKEEADLIFKPFSQIDGSSTRQHGGSGLGLVISRQLVELHGGEMVGSAVPGEGSTFTFTARFGLPSATDHPTANGTPPMRALPSSNEDKHVQAMRPFLLQKTMELPKTSSPGSDIDIVSPGFTSSAGSDPSVRSLHTQQTSRSSVSSINAGLARFSEAAKASGHDISQMTLQMPAGQLSPRMSGSHEETRLNHGSSGLRPPMYSILIICAQKRSRQATAQHIETTLPKEVPHQITSRASVAEADELLGGHESVFFTHVVLNLNSEHEIINVIDRIMDSSGNTTQVLVLSDSVQRQAVLRLASDPSHQQLLAEKRLTFIYKPVKPSRFAVIFDPAHERDVSVDLNRSSAAQMVETQKQNYLEVEKRIGNKGFKVLLVEDNPVNQKVLTRYLKKVGVEAEIAADGVECTDKVFNRPNKYYSLILCDLHMPRKDGYQTCREIRQWEKQENISNMPIIALSANVMSDVQDKCLAAGFNDYVTKPIDFINLSTAMSKYFQEQST